MCCSCCVNRFWHRKILKGIDFFSRVREIIRDNPQEVGRKFDKNRMEGTDLGNGISAANFDTDRMFLKMVSESERIFT